MQRKNVNPSDACTDMLLCGATECNTRT